MFSSPIRFRLDEIRIALIIILSFTIFLNLLYSFHPWCVSERCNMDYGVVTVFL